MIKSLSKISKAYLETFINDNRVAYIYETKYCPDRLFVSPALLSSDWKLAFIIKPKNK
jgi:hypothetical protein